MNITSKRLDKIKKTKNQSKRRIHYKNKKKNGKEKNRRNNRKYNKSTGKYRKTHKRKKRAYDLKNKSLKFKENQPVNKSATLKIITTDKPVETLQTGGGLWGNFKKLFKMANNKKKNEINDLKDEIFAIISVDKQDDNIADFYKWYIDELRKIAFKTEGEDKNYTYKREYYNRNLKYKPFGKAIKNLKNDPDLYTEANKIHLITIFKLTLTDHMTHLEKLFSSDVGDYLSSRKRKNIKYTYPNITRYDDSYNIYLLILKMDQILKAVKEEKEAAKKKAEERKEREEKERKEREAAAEKEAAAAAEKKRKETEEAKKAAAEKKRKENIEKIEKKMKEKEAKRLAKLKKKEEADIAAEKKTEEEINNIKTNIKTPKFNDFLKEVKNKQGLYSGFLNTNEGNTFKMLIENSKVMTGGAEGEAEKGEQQTNDEDNLVKIYDYLMIKDNQDKIRKYLTEEKNTTELENFDAMIKSIEFARFAEATYDHPAHNPGIIVVKPRVPSDDPAVISTDTSDLKTTDALVDLGNFKKHVEVTENVMNRDKQPDTKEGYVEGKNDDN